MLAWDKIIDCASIELRKGGNGRPKLEKKEKYERIKYQINSK